MTNIEQPDSKQVKILFICHASTQIGMGHLLRTGHVARTCSRYANTRVAMLGMHSLCVKMLKKLPEIQFITEIEQLIELVEAYNPDCICFDMLCIDDNIFEKLTAGRLSVSISPVFSHISKVDILFHRSREKPDFWNSFSSKTKIFSGLQYTVIDERVTCISTVNYKKLIGAKTLPVGISMGGTDAPNKTLSLLTKFKELPVPMLFWVLLGEGYTHSYKDLVDALEGSPHEVLLIKSNESMWQILNQCALVFLGGGVTTYEAAYAALPSINLVGTSDNAILLNELVDKGAVYCLEGTQDEMREKAFLELCRLDMQRDELLKMHQNAKKCCIDSEGSARIVKTIIYQVLSQKITPGTKIS